MKETQGRKREKKDIKDNRGEKENEGEMILNDECRYKICYVKVGSKNRGEIEQSQEL